MLSSTVTQVQIFNYTAPEEVFFYIKITVHTQKRDNVVYWKTKRKIKDDLQYTKYLCQDVSVYCVSNSILQ